MIRDSHTLPSPCERTPTRGEGVSFEPPEGASVGAEKAGDISGEAGGSGPGPGEPGGEQVRRFHLAMGQVSRKQVTV